MEFLNQLQETLKSNELKFLGFVLPKQIRSVYEQYYPEDKKQANLNNWAKFEDQYPTTFGGMYQFWVSTMNMQNIRRTVEHRGRTFHRSERATFHTTSIPYFWILNLCFFELQALKTQLYLIFVIKKAPKRCLIMVPGPRFELGTLNENHYICP